MRRRLLQKDSEMGRTQRNGLLKRDSEMSRIQRSGLLQLQKDSDEYSSHFVPF
jgi:hypothetical protein